MGKFSLFHNNIENKTIQSNTKNRLVDIFIKPLPKESFFTIRRELGLIDQSDLDS